MDTERLDVLGGSQLGNSTDRIIKDIETVEPLSIIVCGLGGILLVTLLSLMVRIILSKRKQPFENLDENGEPIRRRRNNEFRIQIDGPPFTGYHNRIDPRMSDFGPEYPVTQERISSPRTGNQMYCHSSLSEYSSESVPHYPTTQITSSSNTGNHSPGENEYGATEPRLCHEQMERVGSQQVSNGSCLNPCSERERETVNSANQCSNTVLPSSVTSNTTRTISPVPNGNLARINRYLISPPPYQQVVSSNKPQSSVIVAKPTRRLDFSL